MNYTHSNCLTTFLNYKINKSIYILFTVFHSNFFDI